jgi:hypothetical protein
MKVIVAQRKRRMRGEGGENEEERASIWTYQSVYACVSTAKVIELFAFKKEAVGYNVVGVFECCDQLEDLDRFNL